MTPWRYHRFSGDGRVRPAVRPGPPGPASGPAELGGRPRSPVPTLAGRRPPRGARWRRLCPPHAQCHPSRPAVPEPGWHRRPLSTHEKPRTRNPSHESGGRVWSQSRLVLALLRGDGSTGGPLRGPRPPAALGSQACEAPPRGAQHPLPTASPWPWHGALCLRPEQGPQAGRCLVGAHEGLGSGTWGPARASSHPGAQGTPTPGDHWGPGTTCRSRPQRTRTSGPQTPASTSVWQETGCGTSSRLQRDVGL